MMVIFQETNHEFLVTALERTQQQWQEKVAKAATAVWLQQAYHTARLHRKDVLLLIVPETALVRRLVPLPPQSDSTSLQQMAANMLLPFFEERPAALSVYPLSKGDCCAVVGCSKQLVMQQTAPFGRYGRRVQLIGAADLALAQAGVCDDGYYLIQDLLWTSVVAVVDGRIVDAHAESGSMSASAMAETLRTAHQKDALLTLPEGVSSLPSEAAIDSALLRRAALKRKGAVTVGNWRGDKVLGVLLVLCALIPLSVIIGLTLRPDGAQPEAQQSTPVDTVNRSDYATLLTQAYAAKDARITLLSHETGDGSLAITGRCLEPLDLAAYMRALAEVEPNLHPLLLELTRTTVDEQSQYDFVVEIALEKGGGE